MIRSRRLRTTALIRDLVRETRLHPSDLIQPFFVIDGKGKTQPVPSMPGIARHSVDTLLKAVGRFLDAGGRAGLFFGLPARKDPAAREAYSPDGVVQRAVRAVKRRFPELVVITDVCLCSYTDHGHCGIIRDKRVDNDRTVEVLAKAAVSHAEAGVDLVAPSDMMDLRVRAIRGALDGAKFLDTGILSYAVKYASAYYGPFREAADCKPSFGDRKTYQMDPGNSREALKEARQDVAEGADIVMVKPALAYLDIVRMLKQDVTVPVAAYNVSGEYSMVKAAAAKGWINERELVLETLLSMKRAGADLIISYHSQDVLGWL